MKESLSGRPHTLFFFQIARLIGKNFSNHKKFDYLFSIINPFVLPPEIIQLAHISSVNFHNALLPKYAGVHASSWSILNNEMHHGTTWHIIAPELDEGDILKQQIIPIEPEETALSLELKCHKEGLKLFQELTLELAQGTVERRSQNLHEKTYFALHQKPLGNGLISWQSRAEDLERTFRAFQFGPWHQLATPKLLIQDQVVVPLELSLSQTQSTLPPGMVVKVTDTELHVATQSQNITIKNLVF